MHSTDFVVGAQDPTVQAPRGLLFERENRVAKIKINEDERKVRRFVLAAQCGPSNSAWPIVGDSFAPTAFFEMP